MILHLLLRPYKNYKINNSDRNFLFIINFVYLLISGGFFIFIEKIIYDYFLIIINIIFVFSTSWTPAKTASVFLY